MNGSYAMLLKGFDSAGNPALIGGVLTFNGSPINPLVTGTIDMNLNSGVQTKPIQKRRRNFRFTGPRGANV